MVPITLRSREDESVNFIMPIEGTGSFEARYVRREDDYFIVYLSSHAGCDKACRFCHLTAMGETSMAPAMLEDYCEQAERVMTHYDSLRQPARRVHFNFMARGEPLANPVVLANWPVLAERLRLMAARRGLTPQFNISTIMPREIERIPLADVFTDAYTAPNTAIYYSLYSLRPEFRRRWLPKALDPHMALDKLKVWQSETGGDVVLHWAFIDGQNDDRETVQEVIDVVDSIQLRVRFNLVRYNPYSAAQGMETEPQTLQVRFDELADAFGDPRSKIVPRVGYDVSASCGMFVDGHNPAVRQVERRQRVQELFDDRYAQEERRIAAKFRWRAAEDMGTLRSIKLRTQHAQHAPGSVHEAAWIVPHGDHTDSHQYVLRDGTYVASDNADLVH